ncbi:MAG: hypothetical protein JO099_08790 [Acidobacteriia bacterium]|nr:hypothetical protein [Terriglobia bacterium]
MSLLPTIETQGFDPLLATAGLPYSAMYFPVGHYLRLATNSGEVLAAASESWGMNRPEFTNHPIEIRVIVHPEGALSPQPAFRCQRHICSVVGDADNFAAADLEQLFAYAFVSAQTAADHAWLRWFFLESLAYLLLAQRYVVPLHAASLARQGAGVLLCGRSGAGKSTLAFACARAGWTYVSDDCTWLLPAPQCYEAIGSPAGARFRPESVDLFPELARYLERARPNGKISIEIPFSDFPYIQTGRRCSVRFLVFLDRRSDMEASLTPISSNKALDLLLEDHASYTPETDALHNRTFQTLASLPAYRLRYAGLEEGRRLLESLIP